MNRFIYHDGPHDNPGHIDKPKDGSTNTIKGECAMIIKINGAQLKFFPEGVSIDYDGYSIMVDKCCKDPKINTPKKDTNLSFYNIEIIKNKDDEKSLGELFINGKKIDYQYNYVTGEIGQHSLFNIFYNLTDLARSYISANPSLADTDHHH